MSDSGSGSSSNDGGWWSCFRSPERVNVPVLAVFCAFVQDVTVFSGLECFVIAGAGGWVICVRINRCHANCDLDFPLHRLPLPL